MDAPTQRDANRHMASEEPPTPRSSLGSLPSPRKRVSVLTSPKDRQRAPVDATAQEFNVNLQRSSRRWRSTSKELNPAELKKLMATRSGSFRRPSEEEEESPQARSPPSKVVPFDDDSDDGEGIVLLADAEAEAEVRALSEHDPLVRALARGPAARSVDDLKLIEGATADVKFFERLSRDQHLELCRVMTHELVDKESVVFSQGDEGTTFYIIYKGAATVYVPDDDREKGQGSLGQAATALQSLARRRGSVVTADGLRLARQQTCVCMLEDGDSFGELALLGSGVRQATVVTAMATRFLKIEKEAYERSLQKLHEAELQQRVAYLQGVFVFSDWSDDDLYKLAYVMSSRRYEKNATIIAQGETTDSLFFVKAGTCRVLKRLVLSARHQLMLGSPRGAPSAAAGGRGGRTPTTSRPTTTTTTRTTARRSLTATRPRWTTLLCRARATTARPTTWTTPNRECAPNHQARYNLGPGEISSRLRRRGRQRGRLRIESRLDHTRLAH